MLKSSLGMVHIWEVCDLQGVFSVMEGVEASVNNLWQAGHTFLNLFKQLRAELNLGPSGLQGTPPIWHLYTYPKLYFISKRWSTLITGNGLCVSMFSFYVLSYVRECVAVEITHATLVVSLTFVPAKRKIILCYSTIKTFSRNARLPSWSFAMDFNRKNFHRGVVNIISC